MLEKLSMTTLNKYSSAYDDNTPDVYLYFPISTDLDFDWKFHTQRIQ